MHARMHAHVQHAKTGAPAYACRYSSTRIENMFMGVGSAAGVAARQLVDGSARTVQDINVTKVQALLNGTFQQRIHGPPHHPAPPPAPPRPQWYAVSGAGSAGWNGKYELAKETYDGRPVYRCTLNTTRALYSSAGDWRLAVEGVELFYVVDHPTPLPPLTGWTVANGASPVPQLVAGPV